MDCASFSSSGAPSTRASARGAEKGVAIWTRRRRRGNLFWRWHALGCVYSLSTIKARLSAFKGGQMASSKHQVRFPGESSAYRDARDELLDAEVELRRATEAVAMQRRKLPLGGEVPEDYVFDEIVDDYGKSTQRKVHMSELFAPGKDSLILYNFMYG